LLAASNLPWELDPALLWWLEKRILVPLPEVEAREDMIWKLIPPENSNLLDYWRLAELTEGYSGSDMKLVCKEAAMKPLRALMRKIEDLDGDAFDWKPVNPKDIPKPDKVSNLDFEEALAST